MIKLKYKFETEISYEKTAILVYDTCNFEISVALEILAMAEKPITVYAKELKMVTSEEGLKIFPDKSISDIDINEYDSLLLLGAMDIREAIEDDEISSFIKLFDECQKI